MDIYVVRFTFGPDDTGGIVFVNGVAEAFSLEDEQREEKVYGETCIPEGTYRCGLRTEGGFHNRYAQRFANNPDIDHIGMIQILDVPDFEYILFHCGNDDDDTAGCVLVAEELRVKLDGDFPLQDSESAYIRFYNMVAPAINRGEIVRVHITTERERQ